MVMTEILLLQLTLTFLEPRGSQAFEAARLPYSLSLRHFSRCVCMCARVCAVFVYMYVCVCVCAVCVWVGILTGNVFVRLMFMYVLVAG